MLDFRYALKGLDACRQAIWRVGEACTLLAAVLSAVAFWSWAAGVADLFAPAPLRVPMSPSAAGLLLLTSLALFVNGRWPEAVGVRRVGGLILGLAGLAGLGMVVSFWLEWNWSVVWLTPAANQATGVYRFRMSPLVGSCLFLLTSALLLSWGHRRGAWWAWLSAGGAVAVLVVCAFAAQKYLAGRLWLGNRLVAPSLQSLICLCLLSLACLVRSLPRPELVRPIGAGGEGARGLAAWPEVSMPLFVSALLALGIGLVTAAYLRHEQGQDRADARELLRVVGQLKASQVNGWREERFADAWFFSRAAFVARDAQNFLAEPDSPRTRRELRQWLTLLKAGDRYERVELFDTNLVSKMAVPEPTMAADPALREWLKGVLLTNAVVMADLQAGPGPTDLHLDIGFSILEPPNPSLDEDAASPNPRRPIGVVLLRLKPSQFLFPLIQSWPTPSRSAESVLVRREGGDVLFLNDLRHRPDSALRLRQPIRLQDPSAEALAVLGQTGSIVERDYRGFPVLATAQTVTNTPWILVAKIDCDEVYVPLIRQAKLTLAVTLLLAVAAGLLTWVVRHRREAALARRELAAERERLALARRIEHLLRGANDAILLADEQERIVEANDRTVTTYGYSMAELRGLRLPDLYPPVSRTDFARYSTQTLAEGGLRFTAQHQRKDGSVFPVEVSASVIELDGKLHKLEILRDMTERKAAEDALRDSLREKEALLREVHHRVKNNLQLISSLLRLQEGQFENRIVQAVLQDTRGRIRSIALLHEALYRSGDLACVDLAQYLGSLVSYLQRALPEAARIPIGLDVARVLLSLDQAVPCGLIINELVTNSLKHAFPQERSGEIRVSLQPQSDGELELRVSDNGVGLPAALALDRVSSLGLQIVQDLAQQLGARLDILRSPETVFTLRFRKDLNT